VSLNQAPPPAREAVINLPPATALLIAANLAVQGLLSVVSDGWVYRIIGDWGFVPARFVLLRDFSVPALLTPLSYQFLHGGWLHVGMNMIMLAAFGSGVERALGSGRLVALYLFTGVLAALGHLAVYPNDLSPVVGASGAISGLFGAVMLLMRASGRLAASGRQFWLLVAIWIGVGALDAFGVGLGGEGVAWVAHGAGLLAGLALTPFFMRRA
jgi:membrane associated rhomboid family serine protease